MSAQNIDSTEIQEIKFTIDKFLDERLQEKLSKTKEEEMEKREEERSKHKPIAWLSSAAERSTQLQVVTNAIKYLNPDARGTSIYVESEIFGPQPYLSTASLIKRENDVDGNAGALDVYKFLQLNVAGETLYERFLRKDEALISALPGSEEEKAFWFESFSMMKRPKNSPSSHSLAKQVYYPDGQGSYHLLAPLFPTTLAHEIYSEVQRRFTDETWKEARNARKEGKMHVCGFREFPNLVVQSFGGAKPLNISGLNSKRRGVSFLLPSLPPPFWNVERIREPLNIKSIFVRRIFGKRAKNHIQDLRKLLRSHSWQNNIDLRLERDRIVDLILEELVLLVSEFQTLPKSWSSKPECVLREEEKFWLDPFRADGDESWRAEKENSNWKEDCADSFATWLNQSLQSKKLRFGTDERREWVKKFLALDWEIQHD